MSGSLAMLLAGAVLLVSACTSGTAGGQASLAAPTDPRVTQGPEASEDSGVDDGGVPEVHPAHLEPLRDLPACQPSPTPAGDRPDDLVTFPAQTVVTTAQDTGPLKQVSGYIGLAPAQVLAFYLEQEDLQILHIENEIFDAEVLVTDGERRVLVTTQAVCPQGSRFVAFVVPEQSAASLPSPAPPAP